MHSSPLSRRGLRLITVAGACLAVGLATLPADAVHPTHSRIVSADPVDWTPHVLDGQVNAVVQVGDIAVVGGTFTQVRAQGSTTTLTRNYLFALDTTTGAIVPGFAPTLNNTVESVVVAPGGDAVIVGGSFTAVNGANRRRLARINLGSGQLETGFVANTNSLVEDLVLRNGWLYASGKFTTVKGVARSGVARLDPVTGAVDPQLNLPFTDPPRSTMNVQEIEVSPAGTQLVAVGNFGRVAGVSRIQIAMLDLTTTPVSLANWQTDEFPVFNPAAPTATWCSSTFPSYMRGVDFSPDGSYFVVITTGANRPERMCDTASRWESSARGAGLKPSWVNWTGGDTLTAVAITGAAIYVGGHQQYMNNPYVPQACGVCPGPGPGGIPRQGLAALDPVNGLPFSWDPGRARGYGVNSFFGTAEGLWLGSDTDTLGGETHRKLGFFPTAGGLQVPANDPYPITSDLYNLSQATGRCSGGRTTRPDQVRERRSTSAWTGARPAVRSPSTAASTPAGATARSRCATSTARLSGRRAPSTCTACRSRRPRCSRSRGPRRPSRASPPTWRR